MLEWKYFNLAERNVMTTTSNVFTVLSQNLCHKMKMLHMLVGTPRATSSNLFFKTGFKADIYTKLFLFIKIMLKHSNVFCR